HSSRAPNSHTVKSRAPGKAHSTPATEPAASRFREPAPVEREEGGPDSQRAKRCSELLPHHCDHYWPDRKPAWDKDTYSARQAARTRFSGMDSCFRGGL